jgi:hypothetical protein
MTDKTQDPTSDSAHSDPAVANKNREELKEQAEKGMRDAKDKLPKDQV